MAVIFVSEHEGAHRLACIDAKKQKLSFTIDRHCTHIDAGDPKAADTVIKNVSSADDCGIQRTQYPRAVDVGV